MVPSISTNIIKRPNRIAFDIHGVLDTYTYFRQLAKTTYTDGYSELIIVTGSLFNANIQKLFKKHNIQFHEYYSITQHLLDKDPSLVTWIDGNPYAEDEIWNSAKAEICKEHDIHLLYDDSPIYGKYFQDHPTLYVEVQNGKWKESGRHS